MVHVYAITIITTIVSTCTLYITFFNLEKKMNVMEPVTYVLMRLSPIHLLYI